MKRHFQRVYNMMDCKLYIKNEDIPESKEIFFYEFKHFKTDKINNYILVECESEKIF